MKRHYTSLAIALLLVPSLASAQGLQTYLPSIITFINQTLLPFLFGIAFLLFAINVIRYFVIGGANEDARENAKNVALYSVLAFVFLIIFWGVINLLTAASGFNGQNAPCPDYTGCLKKL